MFSRLRTSAIRAQRLLHTQSHQPTVASPPRRVGLSAIVAGAFFAGFAYSSLNQAPVHLDSPESSSSSQDSSTTDPSPAPDAQPEGENGKNQSAFNPETGEINWDCPCLGGMAYGPCGEQFRAAFSCFIFSEQEPKGIDCVEKFKGMQECFREHPEVYPEEADEDEAEVSTGETEPAPVPAVAQTTEQTTGDLPEAPRPKDKVMPASPSDEAEAAARKSTPSS